MLYSLLAVYAVAACVVLFLEWCIHGEQFVASLQLAALWPAILMLMLCLHLTETASDRDEE